MNPIDQTGKVVQTAHGHLAQLASDVLTMAKTNGATEADVVVADGTGQEVSCVGRVVELDYGLGTAEVGFGFATQQRSFKHDITVQIA